MATHDSALRRVSLKTVGPILIGVGGVLSGAITSYYQNVYVPKHSPRTLNASGTLEKVGENRQFIALKGMFKIKNIAKGRSELLAGYYNVWGTRIVSRAEVTSEIFAKDIKESLATDRYPFTQFAQHYLQDQAWNPIAFHKLWDEEGQPWMDPDLEYTVVFHVFVPPKRYNLIRSQILLLYAKRDDRKSVSTQWDVGPYGTFANFCEKSRDFDKDHKCELIDGTKPEGAKKWDQYELGEIDSVAEVSLLTPVEGIAKKP